MTDTTENPEKKLGEHSDSTGLHSSDGPLPLSHRQRLMEIARNAITSLVNSETDFHISLDTVPPSLRREQASFVTLNLNNRLRGCIGSLIAHRPLVIDVAENAQAAASRDPRFKPITLAEYQQLEIHLSILSIPTEIAFTGKEQLLDQIRPGIDGLILEEGSHRATYLPSVWKQIPDAESFLRELRQKAGLDPDNWSPVATVFRYTTEEFS